MFSFGKILFNSITETGRDLDTEVKVGTYESAVLYVEAEFVVLVIGVVAEDIVPCAEFYLGDVRTGIAVSSSGNTYHLGTCKEAGAQKSDR